MPKGYTPLQQEMIPRGADADVLWRRWLHYGEGNRGFIGLHSEGAEGSLAVWVTLWLTPCSLWPETCKLQI